MTAWRTGGGRGDALEDLILYTNTYYQRKGLGRIDPVNIPIKVLEIDDRGLIRKAFFEKKSTVDFIGVIQGVAIAFDAKETTRKSLPLYNIHEHQIDYMRDFNDQKGLSFLICHFKDPDRFFLIPYELVEEAVRGKDRSSIAMAALDDSLEIHREHGGVLNYLPTLNAYLRFKEKRVDKKPL